MDNIKKNNQTGIPLGHYRARLLEQKPEEICLRTGAEYDAAGGELALTLLGRAVRIKTAGQEAGNGGALAYYAGDGGPLHGYEEILLLRFLLDGRFVRGTGKFLAYDEMPWGALYLPNFRGRCVNRLAGWAGRDPAALETAAAAIGAARASAGDFSCDVEFMTGLFVRLIIWRGDEEFPASAQILFSDNFQYAFDAEDMAFVGDLVIGALKTAARARG